MYRPPVAATTCWKVRSVGTVSSPKPDVARFAYHASVTGLPITAIALWSYACRERKLLSATMLREIAVPFVQQDLAPAETYAQLADSLEALVAASDSVIDCFIAHVAGETGLPVPHLLHAHPKACTGSQRTWCRARRCHRQAFGAAANR